MLTREILRAFLVALFHVASNELGHKFKETMFVLSASLLSIIIYICKLKFCLYGSETVALKDVPCHITF